MIPQFKNVNFLPLDQNIGYFLNFMWANTVYIYNTFFKDILKSKSFRYSTGKKHFSKHVHIFLKYQLRKENPSVD